MDLITTQWADRLGIVGVATVTARPRPGWTKIQDDGLDVDDFFDDEEDDDLDDEFEDDDLDDDLEDDLDDDDDDDDDAQVDDDEDDL